MTEQETRFINIIKGTKDPEKTLQIFAEIVEALRTGMTEAEIMHKYRLEGVTL